MSDATVHKGSIEPQTTTPAAGQVEVAMHAAEQGMELRRTNVRSRLKNLGNCWLRKKCRHSVVYLFTY
jgi:hypothetical protein